MLGSGHICPDQGRDLGRQRHDATYLIANAAQLFVEHQRIQLRHAAFEARLAVQVPEIARIIEASGQHAGIAQRDFLAAVGRLHIGHDDEMRREAAGLGIADDEILLIDPQGQANDFRR